MTKKISTIVMTTIFILVANFGKAQVSAMDFNKNDCYGLSHHLFDDLDSGKAVLLHFFMPNCGMCPPPAQALQKMANGVNAVYPGLVIGYAFPFNNTTTCSYANSWVSNNHVGLYTAMDSGAVQVANYGGFGMPTVVLLGGLDHRVSPFLPVTLLPSEIQFYLLKDLSIQELIHCRHQFLRFQFSLIRLQMPFVLP
jgi:hypothetical protein